jgi:hypothetical protein
MSLTERLYRVLLWLYPVEHRRAYGELMVQHARDLKRAARSQRRWQSARLGFWLLKDGVLNAALEYLEAIEMAYTRFKPIPWSGVLLTA